MNDSLLAIFTGLLVVVGFLQWWILRKHEQWMEKHDAKLEKLAQAASDNAKAVAVAMRQTVDICPINSELSKFSNDGSAILNLMFEVRNPTNNTLSLEKLVTKVSVLANIWETFTLADINVKVVPAREGEKGYPFFTPMPVNNEQRRLIHAGYEMVFTVNGEVHYRDCLGDEQIQWFGGLYKSIQGKLTYMRPMGIAPDHHTEQHS